MIGRGGGRGGAGCKPINASDVIFDTEGTCLTQTNLQTVAEYLAGRTGLQRERVAIGQTIFPGHVVYVDTAGEARLAQADAMPQAFPHGMAVTSAGGGADVCFVTHGPVTLDNWSLITGTPTLVPGTCYFLDYDNPGVLITDSVPAGTEGWVVLVGQAISSNTLQFEVFQLHKRTA